MFLAIVTVCMFASVLLIPCRFGAMLVTFVTMAPMTACPACILRMTPNYFVMADGVSLMMFSSNMFARARFLRTLALLAA